MMNHQQNPRQNRIVTIFRIRLVWLGYAVALFTATHMPIPEPVAEVVSAFDKFLHGLAFFILAVLSVCSVLRKESRLSSWILLAVLFIGFAALDEYLQGFVNRIPDINDWIADSVGILVGCAVMFPFRNRLPSRVPKTTPSRPPVDLTLTSTSIRPETSSLEKSCHESLFQ